MPHQTEVVSADAAEMLAIEILGFLAERPEALDRFLALSGIAPTTLRQAAADTTFLTGVLDYLMSDERLLVAFSDTAGVDPQAIARARLAMDRGTPDP